jgi:hypothetical protein
MRTPLIWDSDTLSLFIVGALILSQLCCATLFTFAAAFSAKKSVPVH